MPKKLSDEFVDSDDDESRSPAPSKKQQTRGKVRGSTSQRSAETRRGRLAVLVSGPCPVALNRVLSPWSRESSVVLATVDAVLRSSRTIARTSCSLADTHAETADQKAAKRLASDSEREAAASDSEELSEDKPLQKKTKTNTGKDKGKSTTADKNAGKEKKSTKRDRSESPQAKRKVGAAAKYGSGVEAHTNAEGEKFVELAANRRATVRVFKGKPYVDIRETYEQGGETKPGKKGIMVSYISSRPGLPLAAWARRRISVQQLCAVLDPYMLCSRSLCIVLSSFCARSLD